MKIGFISDTHTQHKNLRGLEEIDLLIHAGDICSKGTQSETADFIDWFNGLAIRYKVFVAGNHDFFMEKTPSSFIRANLNTNTFYLNDDGIIIEGIQIWGSPIQPWFFDWAFNRQRGEEIKKHWDLIPMDTDILITHGPPFGILDKTKHGQHVGCEELLSCVERIKPKVHVFGHIHEGYGMKETSTTAFMNASVLDVNYRLVNKPIIINYK
jgi:Icc-related predicted phosphoesterase